MKKIIIFGTGAFSKLAKFYFENTKEYEVIAFTVDRSYLKEEVFQGLPVVPFERILELYPPNEYLMFVAIGYSKLNRVREEKYYECKELGYDLASYISEHAHYVTKNPVGDNTIIMEGCSIQPFSKIGSNNIFYPSCVVGHDSLVNDHNCFAAGTIIAGHCIIRSNCFIGLNSTIHHGVEVADRNIIGAGAIISRTTMPDEVYLPARSVKIDKKSFEINI
jgi:sugar O-acyltransferase (sialic acid O-acetyltransferase NeuD family)